MGECRKLFKNEIWNCTIDNRQMIKELPSFVKPTVPYGKCIPRLKRYLLKPFEKLRQKSQFYPQATL